MDARSRLNHVLYTTKLFSKVFIIPVRGLNFRPRLYIMRLGGCVMEGRGMREPGKTQEGGREGGAKSPGGAAF